MYIAGKKKIDLNEIKEKEFTCKRCKETFIFKLTSFKVVCPHCDNIVKYLSIKKKG